ncbi:MAG: hypothetical protein OHK0045_09230 [Raineya sp.]
MKKIFFHLLVITFSVFLCACNSNETEKKEGKQSNKALNDELQEEHYELIKEQSQWAKEKDLFHRRLDTLKKIYDQLKPQHETGYDELIEKLDNLMLKHFDLIVELSKAAEEHTSILTQHQENKIDDRQVQDKHKAFYLKHKEMDKRHEELIESYESVIKKVEDFVTKAGGKLPDLKSLEQNQPTNTPPDTTKK